VSWNATAPAWPAEVAAPAARGADISCGKTQGAATPEEGPADGLSDEPSATGSATPDGGPPESANDEPTVSPGRQPIRAVVAPTLASAGTEVGTGAQLGGTAGHASVSLSGSTNAAAPGGALNSAVEAPAAQTTTAPTGELAGATTPAQVSSDPPAQTALSSSDGGGQNAAAASQTRWGQRIEGAARSDQKTSPASPQASSPASSSSPEGPKTQPKVEDKMQPPNQHQNQNQDQPPAPEVAAAPPSQPVPAVVATAAPTPPPPNPPPPASSRVPAAEVPAQLVAADVLPDGSAAPASMTVQSARVLERVGQSEMRVGVNTASFGNVELHATLNQDQVGASIATSHLELHAAMMAEMPSLQRAMEQHHLRLDSLDLNARAGSEDSGGAGGHQPRSQPGTQSAYRFSGAGGPLPPPDSPAPPGGMAPHSWGLNVHA